MKKRKMFYLIFISLLIAVISVTNIFFLSVFRVTGVSMQPTLKNGSYVIVRKNAEIQRENIVLVYDQNGEYIIKRVIGLGGDHIQITKSSVHVNGNLIDCRENHKNSEFEMEIDVPDNTVFLLGDNRKESVDSRMFGCLSVDKIIGVVLISDE